MSHFLSVDIDYWNLVDNGLDYADAFLDRLAYTAKLQDIPLSAVMNHQQMLPHVSASSARTLINIDTHSDLAPKGAEVLDCGSWVAYVPWRRQGTYHWIHASELRDGDCSLAVYSTPMFRNTGRPAASSDWRSIRHRTTSSLPAVSRLLKDCSGICVCSSPDYADGDLYEYFTQWRREYNLPYKHGRKNEDYGRMLRPS